MALEEEYIKKEGRGYCGADSQGGGGREGEVRKAEKLARGQWGQKRSKKKKNRSKKKG